MSRGANKMGRWLKATQRRLAPTVAVLVALTVSGIGIAYGSSHPSAHPARAAKGKGRSHALSADYKSGRIGLDNTTDTTWQFDDQATLVGRPFGGKQAKVDELPVLTFSNPGTNDSSGSYHTTFKADVFPLGRFRGFYDFSVASDGNRSSATGVITGGSGIFRRARGSFQVLDWVPLPGRGYDRVQGALAGLDPLLGRREARPPPPPPPPPPPRGIRLRLRFPCKGDSRFSS